jgi:hypothetical protein
MLEIVEDQQQFPGTQMLAEKATTGWSPASRNPRTCAIAGTTSPGSVSTLSATNQAPSGKFRGLPGPHVLYR